MKILHCSDLHLGRRPVGGIGDYSESRFNDYFDSFSHIADYAVENSVETVIIPGDIFDRREITPEILERAERIFIRMKEAGISAIISEGNHDRGGTSDSTWLNYLVHRKLAGMPEVTVSGDDNYTFQPVVLNDINFYSMGYPGIYVEEMSRSLADALDPDKINIILAHTAIGSGGSFPGTVTPGVIDLFRGKAFYIAGGHFHSYHHYPEKEPFFFVPGSPEYWDISERDEKYFIVFDTVTGKRERIDTSRRRRIELEHVFISSTDTEFNEEFDNWLMALSFQQSPVVVCRFVVDQNLYPDGTVCEKKIESAGALKARVTFSYGGPADSSVPGDSNMVTTESIEREKLESSGYSSGIAEKIIVRYLPELKKIQLEDQPPEHALELFDRMIEEMIGGI